MLCNPVVSACPLHWYKFIRIWSLWCSALLHHAVRWLVTKLSGESAVCAFRVEVKMKVIYSSGMLVITL
jgi:hypothetical protein